MRILGTSIFLFVVGLALPASAESPQLGRVLFEASNTEIAAPGLIGVEVHLFDLADRPIHPRRIPETWDVRVTRGGAPVFVELMGSAQGPWLEGELTVRRSGTHRLRGRVTRGDAVLAESEAVAVTAAAAIDYGVVRAGETVCHELPGGGRGLLGNVSDSSLPSGLRLWGACLVADDGVESGSGTFRAAVVVQSGSGQGRNLHRRLYDITYRTEPRLLTPRRIFYGVFGGALLAMILGVFIAVRPRRQRFGPGTALAWAPVEGSPYRGDRAAAWQLADLEASGKAAVDVGQLVGLAALGSNVLRVQVGDDGLVEFRGPRGEEIRALTPDDEVIVGHRRLSVPYGSTVSFRSVLLSPLLAHQTPDSGPTGITAPPTLTD